MAVDAGDEEELLLIPSTERTAVVLLVRFMYYAEFTFLSLDYCVRVLRQPAPYPSAG